MQRIKYAIVLGLLTFLLSALPARADIIQTQTFGPFFPPQTPVLAFNQYNGNIGDITGIVIDLSITTTGGLAEVDNESGATTATVSFGTQAALNYFSSTVTVPLELVLNVTKAYVSQTFNLGADDGDGIGVQSGGADYGVLAGGTVSSLSSANVSSGVWAQYVGAGTYNIVLDASTYLNVSASGSVSQGSSPPTASGYVTVTYQGAGGGGGSAPEPASLVLLSSSLGGLAFWRYSRKRKKGRGSPEA
ncbi:MAG: choice-of-anchor E domain-containing protein [Proteobacteria bacterium]|nr:choice-of-anchor E domain-containing protein [Pseudomonadota bacterium]MBU1449738.1 choice-of-anchor E domain-containing protein [Pseudomonadota bacterium]MBU2468567.1 choice-of-anchor E domain-containing protein [Pseudomonadota bacterium]MBU2519124.1 choice-of-anchor E domain-containing protein [Pseudomonadota bacterium]